MLLVIGARPSSFGLAEALSRWNDRLYPAFAQPLSDTASIIPSVSGKPPGSAPRAGTMPWNSSLFQNRFDLCHLLVLARCEASLQGESVAVSQEVDLGREPADGASEGMVAGFSTCIWPPFFRAPAAAR